MTRVLILEDDPALLEVVQMLLEDAGFAVLTASTVGEAEAALSTDFQAAVLDLGVAGLDIQRYIDRLRGLPNHPNVLLCSASTQLHQVARELNCPTLAKPFDIDDLVGAVGRLVKAA